MARIPSALLFARSFAGLIGSLAAALLLLVPLAGLVPAQDIVVLEDRTTVQLQGHAGQRLGATLPKPGFGAWRVGEPLAHAADGVQVYAFYTTKGCPELSGDVEYLAELARQFADRGVQFAVVVEPGAELPDALGTLRVVEDVDNAVGTAWCGGEPGQANVLVVGPSATLTFRAGLGRGVVDAIDRTLSGKTALADVARMALELNRVASNFDSVVGKSARRQIDPVLRLSPRDGYALGLSYLIASTKERDADKAETWRLAATDRLANLPRPLALFVDLVLRGEERPEKLAKQLLLAIVPASALAANDPVVQLAHLRVLICAGLHKQAGRQAAKVQKLAMTNPEHAAVLCELLTRTETPAAYEPMCEQALAVAARGGIAANRLAALRYLVAARCSEDPDAAKKVLDTFVQKNGGASGINNTCWYLMTDVPTMGRYSAFGVALAERMLTNRGGMSYFEFDTVAYAMFLDGRFKEAVELQETAIQKGGGNDPEYKERLARYEAAAAAAAGR